MVSIITYLEQAGASAPAGESDREGGGGTGRVGAGGNFPLKMDVLAFRKQRFWRILQILYPNAHFPLKMNAFTTILEDSPDFLARRSVSWTFTNECFGEKATILQDSTDFLAKRSVSFENERFGLQKTKILKDSPDFLAKRFKNERFGLQKITILENYADFIFLNS